MSDLGDPPTPRSALPTLEPWAVELEQRERGHLDPDVQRELATVVALLRALPDPEPSARLSESILERVAADAARPRVLRGEFGRTGRAAALALAAGVAGLFVISGGPSQLGWLTPVAPQVEPGHVVIQLPPGVRSAPRFVGAGAFPARPGGRLVGQPQLVALSHETESFTTGLPDPQRVVSAWDRHLDHQLNQLLLDPDGFASWLEEVPRRDDLIARLAQRAGERGDAPEVAMRVRESEHPVAGQIVNRMLRAAVVESVSRR